MRVRLFLLSVAVCGACLFAVAQPPAPAEPQQVARQIDFDALHAQAAAALTALQQSHDGPATLASAVEF
jgi:hypothetical protein